MQKKSIFLNYILFIERLEKGEWLHLIFYLKNE